MKFNDRHLIKLAVATLIGIATAVISIATILVFGALKFPDAVPRPLARATFGFRWPIFLRRGWTFSNGMKIFADPADQVITPQLVEYGVWEPGLTALVRQRLRRGDNLVDVGANVGYYTLLAAKIVGPAGQVIAFEPVPAEFELMRRGVEANAFWRGIHLEQKALSDKPGTLDLYISTTNRGGHSIVQTSGESKISVPAITLDEYLSPESHIDFIKVDIEGGEGFALEGMQRTLRSNPAVELAIEFSPFRLQHAVYSPKRLLDLLSKDGFALHIINEDTGALARVSPETLLRSYAASHDPELHWDLWALRTPADERHTTLGSQRRF